MKFNFSNISDNIKLGLQEFSKLHDFEICECGVAVDLIICEEKKITIEKFASGIKVFVPEESLIFRAITIILNRTEDNFTYTEPVMFDMRGLMIDGSQANSLINLESTKLLLRLIAGMGYNMFMLYTEDCYELQGEPYFGYLRPKYTLEDFKILDEYAFNLGIELIPCIQTLGHLTELLKRSFPYGSIRDDESSLLVGDEKTYALIEKMISSLSQTFRTNKIHIGLDEVWNLGQGRYLRINGYKNKSEIMSEHLNRIYEITEKYSLEPMMWGDMFFRAKSKSNLYYDLDVTFNEEDRLDAYPNLTPIYWDYYHFEEDFYEKMMVKYSDISDKLIFAGCSRNGKSYGAQHTMSVLTTNPALNMCKKTSVRQVFTTVWGDDNRESSVFTVLPSLVHFSEHFFCEDTPDEDRCAIRFKECTKESYSNFLMLSKLDEVTGYNEPNLQNLCLSRVFMWQDIMLGICDKDLGDFDFSEHYRALRETFGKCKLESFGFEDLFEFVENVADVLEIKSQISRELYNAYKAKNRELLQSLLDNNLPELLSRLKKLHNSHRAYFLKHHKAIGWEVLDIRYGGAISRCETAMNRINDYLNNKIDVIEEFEEERLGYNNAYLSADGAVYSRICSGSRI